MSFITSLVLGKLRSYGSEMSDAHKLDLIEELRDELRKMADAIIERNK